MVPGRLIRKNILIILYILSKRRYEAIEKGSILFKFKEGEDFDHRHTLEYFEDKNLSLTQKLGERGYFSVVSKIYAQRPTFQTMAHSQTD